MLPVLLPVVVVLIVVEVASYYAIKRYASGLGGMPTVAFEEFPEVDEALLEKFSSFDPELGWSPQPNVTKQKDTGDHLPGEEVESVVTYSTDGFGSRVCTAVDRDPEADLSVSTYGDSYCFCREVDDDETFQHYLAEELDAHVGNYGGGNYGLDQALLRLKRQYPEDPSDTVVIVVTASSIARILSVWKHYQEFGNVLAVKPRFELVDGELELVESPVDEKTDLMDLESRKGFLRTHDGHYEPWFRPRLASFPYATDLLRDIDQVRFALYGALQDVEARTGISLPGIDVADRKAQTTLRLEQERVEYHERLFDEEADLLTALLGEFVDYADEQGFQPAFVMVQQLRYAIYEAEHGPIYGDLLAEIDERFPELETIDMSEYLAKDGDVESLYVQRGEGGHYSPESNRRIAGVLTERLFADRRPTATDAADPAEAADDD